MRKKIILAFILLIVASELSNIICREIFHYVPLWLNAVKLILLVAAGLTFLFSD